MVEDDGFPENEFRPCCQKGCKASGMRRVEKTYYCHTHYYEAFRGSVEAIMKEEGCKALNEKYELMYADSKWKERGDRSK